ncbi:hypothetical protein FlaCF_2301 [Flavobacterium tructae]
MAQKKLQDYPAAFHNNLINSTLLKKLTLYYIETIMNSLLRFA